MENDRGAVALKPIGGLFEGGAIGGLGDGELLDRFRLREGGAAESAFAALVERHGPMVLRVARSVVRDGHDAEDAFQATFLVLARKAGSLRAEGSLGPWLHGVALRVAARVRSAAGRRREKERRAAEAAPTSAVDPLGDGDGDGLGATLDEEIDRLPDRYRAAVVLCLVEGLTQEQAADRLGWPSGTVRSRLARGRERLRGRLSRRGLAPTFAAPGAVAVRLSESATRLALACRSGPLSAAVADALIVESASETLRSFVMSRVKVASLLVLAAVVGAAGARALALQKPADPPPAPAKVEPARGPAARWRYQHVQLGSPSYLSATANAEAAKGWELVEVVPEVRGIGGNISTQVFMLFRRPADAKD